MRRVCLLLSCLLLWPMLGWGAVLQDAVSPAPVVYNTTPFTFNHTTSGSNRLLLCAFCMFQNPQPTVSGTPTYAAVGMTQVASAFYSGASGVRLEVWRLIAPATGSNTVSVAISAADAGLMAACVSLTGVDQTTPLGTPVTENNQVLSAASIDVAGATDGLTMDFVCRGGAATPTIGVNQTSIYDIPDTIGPGLFRSFSSRESGSGTKTHSWDWGNFENYAHLAVLINPSVAAGGMRVYVVD